jgi:hypothetical protein
MKGSGHGLFALYHEEDRLSVTAQLDQIFFDAMAGGRPTEPTVWHVTTLLGHYIL